MRRILIANPFGIGDVIFSMTLVEALRQSFPDAFIAFLCNERTEELVRMNPSIDRTFVLHRDLLRRLWRKNPLLFFQKGLALLARLGRQRFDTLFDLSLGREFGFYAMWLGIRKRVGFDFKGRGLFLTHKKKLEGYADKPVTDIQLGLLDFEKILGPAQEVRIPFHVSRELRNEADAFLKKLSIAPSDPIFVMAPGGGRSWGPNAVYKQWDVERFAEVADRIGARRDWKVLLLGDRAEEGLLNVTAKRLRMPSGVVCGERLNKVCAILQRSKFLLSNDGGLMHLANALGVKTVSVFGPVDEKVYGPYRRDVPHAVLVEAVPCRPCYRNFHFPPCRFERQCLNKLSIEKVLDAVERIL